MVWLWGLFVSNCGYICYISGKLNKHHRNYSAAEKEVFGLLFATRD